jgi:ABC-type maltose transport system permease subunit
MSVVSTSASVRIKPTVDEIADEAAADATRLRIFGQYWAFSLALVALSYLAVEAIGAYFGLAEFLGVWSKLASLAMGWLSSSATIVVGYLDSIRYELGITALFAATVLALSLVLIIAQWHDNRSRR